MSTNGKVSWRLPYETRQFGVFVKWLPNGNAQVRKGLRRLEIPRGMLTVEVG